MREKCMNFSIRVVNLCKFLNEEKKEYRMADQLFRSATSIGANYCEALCAVSRNDFEYRIYVSLKESNEVLYWLELLFRTKYLTKTQYESISNDAIELKKILASTTKKLRSESKERKS